MRRSKIRKPPSLHIYVSSRETSPRSSSVLSDWDADDEGVMSSGDFLSRPLSLSIPTGSYCGRRPTLQEVLADEAPPPWTISAFTAYLSQNHCLETLEFTTDANRYTKHFQEWLQKDPSTRLSPQNADVEYVRMLWTKLLDAYIVPAAPREVNLPSDVRDHLLSLPCTDTPPDAAELEPAVRIIYELMEESVLVPFLNSVTPSREPDSVASPWTSNESMTDAYMSSSLDDRALSPAKTRNQRDGTPPANEADTLSKTFTALSPRHSHQSHLTAALGLSRLSANISGSSGTSSAEAPEMTDESTDSPSPSGSAALDPMTPPHTPPTSNAAFGDASPGTSPQNVPSMSWKKMGERLRWKKSRTAQGSGSSSTSGSRNPREGSEEPNL